jgi:hypothetical protein
MMTSDWLPHQVLTNERQALLSKVPPYDLTIEAPASDSFVRAEIARATPVPHRTPFSLLTNPVLLDAPPWATSRRGPDEGPVRGPLGFSRRDIERAREREARRQAAQQLRRAR